MSVRMRTSVGCYLLVSALMVVGGARYALATKVMTYHEAALGRSWEDVDPRSRMMLLALLRGGGAGSIGLGLALGAITAFGMRRGAAWARWAVPVAGLSSLVPISYQAAWLARATGATTPWSVPVLGSVLLLAGALIAPSSAPAQRDSKG